MARCGCLNVCACVVAGDGTTTTVTGSGSVANPYIVSALSEGEPTADEHIADTSDAHNASAVSFVPTGTIAATNVQAAIAEVSGDITAHIADSSDAHDASSISFNPTATIAATDVQAAIEEAVAEATSVPLARTSHNPVLQASPSTGSASFVDVDPTNLEVSFVAPASGKVEITLEAPADLSANGNLAYWALRESAANIPGTERLITRLDNTVRLTTCIYVSGLVAGSSHTYRWAFSVSAGTTRLLYGAAFGPAVMTVRAA